MEFSGCADRDDLGPGIVNVNKDDAANWERLKGRWRESLDGLAHEFLSGYAAVAPDSAKSCRTCVLSSLCRIRELDSVEFIEDDTA